MYLQNFQNQKGIMKTKKDFVEMFLAKFFKIRKEYEKLKKILGNVFSKNFQNQEGMLKTKKDFAEMFLAKFSLLKNLREN